MIKDSSRYYGSAIATLIDVAEEPVIIGRMPIETPGFYLIQEKLPIYIKYSTSRKGPWVFNFQKSHQEAESSVFERYGESIIVFVCGKDGIVALIHQELRELLDEVFDDQESVTIRRRFNEMYRVHGKNGSLNKKFLKIVFRIYITHSSKKTAIKK